MILQPLESKLFQTALGIVGNQHDAQDVWQSTVLKAWTSLPRLRHEQYFRTWVTRIMLNEAKQLLRHRARQPLLPGELPEVQLTNQPEIEQQLLVRACLSQLPDAQRETVLLRYWLDLSLEEIAKAMTIPLSTVKTRLYQGQRTLKTLIEEAERA